MTGHRVDPAELTATADRLDAAADELRAAADALGTGAGGELGPAGITAAVDELIGTWAGRISSVHTELSRAGADVRRARDAYTEGEDQAARELPDAD
ncbi:hypothetical protein [Amycolatopsis magusensis]|uniref:hypothetical protein n=1 Tax=Amycolatopsis magusensis TaxID=882444 RepID=UPI003C2DCE6C